VSLGPDQSRLQGVTMANEPAPGRQSRAAYRIFKHLLFMALCAEIGAVLVVSPWLDIWSQNYLAGNEGAWHEFWMNTYFRGAVSGLGAVNIYIFCLELFRFLTGRHG